MKAVDQKGLDFARRDKGREPSSTFVILTNREIKQTHSNQWLLKCDLKTISITWELVRNANYQAHPQTY